MRERSVAIVQVAVAAALVLALACDRPAPEPESRAAPSVLPARTHVAAPPGSGPAPSSNDRAPPLQFVEKRTGSSASGPLPTIVALHGLGDSPESFGTIFDDFGVAARIIVPRAPTPYHGGYSWFAFDHSNEAVTARGLEQAAARVAALIRWLSDREPRAGKAIVTGFSQGGMLSFVLALRHPDLVAEAFPVSGWLPGALLPGKNEGAAPPIVALHGDEDVRLPLGPTRRGVEALEELGYSAEIRVYPGVGHSIARSERAEWMGLLRDACERLRSRASSRP